MRDENDIDALPRQRPHDRENLLDFLFGQRRRRFVHDDGLRLEKQCARDFDDLLVRCAKLTHEAVFVNRDAELFEKRTRLAAHLAAQQESTFAQFAPEEDVLIDAKVVDGIELLVDEGDAVRNRIVRRTELHGAAVQQDAPRRGRKHPAEDVHQRRFARAILSEQRENLAVGDGQGNVVEHLVRAEGLADVFKGDAHGRSVSFAISTATSRRGTCRNWCCLRWSSE